VSIAEIAVQYYYLYNWDMEPDSLKHLESKSEWTIQQYEKFKQSLTTSPGFLRLSYQQKKQAITHAAAKYPIIGATKQDIINDLKI
jgi:adenylate cyclase